MPRKLKRHIGNYVLFVLACGVVEVVIQTARNMDILEHYGWIQAASIVFFFSISGWFGWRCYTGMERDGDFYDD